MHWLLYRLASIALNPHNDFIVFDLTRRWRKVLQGLPLKRGKGSVNAYAHYQAFCGSKTGKGVGGGGEQIEEGRGNRHDVTTRQYQHKRKTQTQTQTQNARTFGPPKRPRYSPPSGVQPTTPRDGGSTPRVARPRTARVGRDKT